jgi:phosphosulfolactate phosphohydrolase-like enzyme
MEIHVGILISGAADAAGTPVIIDVLRTFTTTAVGFPRGAVASRWSTTRRGIALLYRRKRQHQTTGLDLGKSPIELARVAVTGNTLIQATTRPPVLTPPR